MASEDLKPRQYRRVGRIAENNPERAERVAERMTTKSERAQKGKEIADKYSSSNYNEKYQAKLERMKSGASSVSDYDAINFKNKDVDKFKGKFGKDGLRDTGKTLSLDEIEAIRKPKP